MTRRRIAGAPITWGVCEVPGWGHQMSPGRVLSEMADLGLTATELGPDGFLPGDPDELEILLDRHGLELAAGFVPVMLHDEDRWSLNRAEASRRISTLGEAGASTVVFAASTGDESYEGTAVLTDQQWEHLVDALSELEEIAGEHGLTASLHPHYGTAIEGPAEIRRLLDTSDVGICLDTGHVLVGGGDPVELAESAAERVVHVHLKDVDAALVGRVRGGELGYREAVRDGLYKPLGEGDVDVAAVVLALEDAGYEGWFVLEQDTVLAEEPPPGEGPVSDAEASLRFLRDGVSDRRSGSGGSGVIDAGYREGRKRV